MGTEETTKKKKEDNVGGRETAQDAFNNVKDFFSSVTPNFLKTPIKKIINIRNGTGSDTDEEELISDTDEEPTLREKLKYKTKSFANGVGHFFVNIADYTENKIRSKTELSEDDNQNLESKPDILFDSEKIKSERETEEAKAKQERIDNERHNAEINAAGYLAGSIAKDIERHDAVKKAKQKQLNELKKSKEQEQDAEKKKELQTKIDALQDDFDKYNVDSQAIDDVLKRSDVKAALNRSQDKVKRGEQYDYKKYALEEVLKQEGLSDKQKEILKGAQKRYHEQQVEDMGIINGIKQVFASYQSSYDHETALAEKFKGNDDSKEQLIKDARDKKIWHNRQNKCSRSRSSGTCQKKS